MARHGLVGLLFLLFIQWTMAEHSEWANDNFVSTKQQLSRLTETVRDLARRDEVQTRKVLELEREYEINIERQSDKIVKLQREMTIQNDQLTEKISQIELEMDTQTEKISKLERDLEILRKQSVEKDLQDLDNQKLVKLLISEMDKLKQLADDEVENVTSYNDELKVSNDRFAERQNVQPDTRKDYKHGRDGVKEIQKTTVTVKRSSNGTSRRTRAEVTQVAFSATITPHDYGPLGTNQIVRFDNVLSNIGNAYHAHSGIFTAPVSGTYVISATISGLKVSRDNIYLQIWKNGDHICYIKVNYFGQSTQVVNLNLLANDEIYVTNNIASDIILGQNFSSFSGFLLYSSGENMIIG